MTNKKYEVQFFCPYLPDGNWVELVQVVEERVDPHLTTVTNTLLASKETDRKSDRFILWSGESLEEAEDFFSRFGSR